MRTKGFRYTADPKDAQTVNAWMDRMERMVASIASDSTRSVTALEEGLSGVNETIDGILNPPPPYVAPAVSLSGGQTLEIGAVVANPAISWTVSLMAGHALASQTLTDAGAISPMTLTGSRTFTGANVSSAKTYTMTVSDDVVDGEGGESRSGSTSFAFRAKRHWGVSASGTIDSAGILALAGSELTTGRTQTRYFNPSAEYIWFAWPASLGGDNTIFVVNNLPNSAWEVGDITHTNAQGYTQTYRTFRSTYKQSGLNIKVEVN